MFCGVHFMAETAKILSPDKTVLIPDQRAGCSLADSITAEDLQAWKDEHPGAVVVSYVNTTAAVKALTDICCTSSNAVDVVASIDADREVLFCPDQFLGAHVRRMTGRDNVHVWAGECHVHAGINGDELTDQARKHPDAELFVHPECGCATSALYLAGEGAFPEDRVKILSTGGMLDAARATQARQVLVATEVGMLYQLRNAAPGRRLPGGQRPRVVQVHEDDHPRGAAALPDRGRRRSSRRRADRAAGAAKRAADDRDRPARRRRMSIRPAWQESADVVVIGTGVGGLAAALAAHRAGRRVVVLSKAGRKPGATATHYAQGGIAVVLPDTDDSVDAHVADTLAAGAGLCDPDAVTSIVADGYRAVTELVSDGARFDEASAGGWALSREGGHSRRRIVHAGGDATGAEVQRALDHAAATLDIRTNHAALRLLHDGGTSVTGVLVANRRRHRHHSRAVGDPGHRRAGPSLRRDHQPRRLDRRRDRAGAVGRCRGERHRVHPVPPDHAVRRPPRAVADRWSPKRFAARARFWLTAKAIRSPRACIRWAIWRHAMWWRPLSTPGCARPATPCVYLDARGIEDFERRFPTVTAACRAAGIDPVRQPIPVVPGAHYSCGGVVTDVHGQTELPGLFAAGEVARTGMHGANRLASNSLLEGLVVGGRAGRAAAAHAALVGRVARDGRRNRPAVRRWPAATCSGR